MNTSRRRLTLAYASFVVHALPASMLGIVWPWMRASLQQPLDALGGLLLATTIGYLLSSFSHGRLLLRLGAFPMLLLSWLLPGVGLAAIGVGGTWSLALVGGFLSGIGGGLLDAGLNTVMATRYGPRQMNWLHASFGLGATGGPLLMTAVLAAKVPWQAAYVLAAGLHLVMGLLFVGTRSIWRLPLDAVATDAVATDAAAAPAAAGGPSYRASLSLPSVWLSLLLFFLYVGAETTAGQWSFTLLHESRGVTPEAASAWVSVYWASLTVGRLLVGAVVERLGATLVLRLSLAGLVVAAGLLWLPVRVVGLAGLALAGLSAAPVYPLLMAGTPARVGRAHAANAVGFQIAAGSIGLAALPAVTGLAAGRISLEAIPPAFWLQTVLLLATYEVAVRRRPAAAMPS